MRTLAIISALSLAALAQDTRPRLELSPTFNLNQGGYQSASGAMTGGLGMEGKHLVWNFAGTYDAKRKVNDGTGNNPHGDVRKLGGDLFGRVNGWLLGGSVLYSDLHTTNYQKASWYFAAGGGKDFKVTGDSMRLTATYSPALHTYDYPQGIQITYTAPSPSETSRHVFAQEKLSINWLKTSAVSGLIADTNMSFGILFRF